MFDSDNDSSFRLDYYLDVDIPKRTEESIVAVADDKPLEVDGVRITPSAMIFSDAFEGRKFKSKLVFQNTGKNSAFVRIGHPTSSAFKLEPLIRGQYLASGLSLVRVISYTYLHSSAVRMATVPLFVNEKKIVYRMLVKMSGPSVSIKPKLLDFGTVDAGHFATTRTLLLANDGTMATRFAIDLGDNKLELVVYPMKGLLQARSRVLLSVEVKREHPGSFMQEFWIKTQPPLRIQVTVKFAIPNLSIHREDTCSDFTLVDFERVYYGNRKSKSIIIKNDSTENSMFCIMAEIKDTEYLLSEAADMRPDFKCFEFSQLEGRLGPQERRILQVNFSPRIYPKSKLPDAHYTYAICVVKVSRVKCKDYPIKNIERDYNYSSVDWLSKVVDYSKTSFSSSVEDDDACPSLKYEQSQTSMPSILVSVDVQKILFHGMFEKASLQTTPDSLCLNDLRLNQPDSRVLSLKNMSQHLPIIYRYEKVAGIEVEPKQKFLKPMENVDVNVKVTPFKYGFMDTSITILLLHPNLPREGNHYEIVGCTVVPVTLDTPFNSKAPKTEEEVKPQPTRRATRTRCSAGFNPKDLDYHFDVASDIVSIYSKESWIRSQQSWKLKESSKYGAMSNILGQEPIPGHSLLKSKDVGSYSPSQKYETDVPMGDKSCLLVAPPEDYQVTDDAALLLKGSFFLGAKVKLKKLQEKRDRHPPFIPLTPTQLHKIRISPLNIDLGKIAIKSRKEDCIWVNNGNDFSIVALLKSNKAELTFPDGPRRVIRKNEKEFIRIEYRGNDLGKSNVAVDIVVNENHYYQVALSVEVIAKVIKLSTDELVFYSNQEQEKFIKLSNNLNVPLNFYWEAPKSCFGVQPDFGSIEPNCFLMCVITCTFDLDATLATEFVMLVEGGVKQPLRLLLVPEKPNVAFEAKELVFEHIPLNLPAAKKISLMNMGSETVVFAVQDPEPIPGVVIEPLTGTIRGKGEQIFAVSVLFKACVKFKCAFSVTVQKVQSVECMVSGCVDYPTISIEPKVLAIKKINMDSFAYIGFTLRNRAKVRASVRFDFDFLHTEFFVSESKLIGASEELDSPVNLDPGEEINLYLHFHPVDAASYRFPLPLVVNDILGPPQKNDSDSHISATYLQSKQKFYTELYKAKAIEVPTNLQIVKILASAAGCRLKFNLKKLEFSYFPHSDYACTTKRELKVWNKSNDPLNLCVCLEHLDDAFRVTGSGDGVAESSPMKIVLEMRPQQEIVLLVTFRASKAGNYISKIPIHITSVNSDVPHNHLTFIGVYPAALLEPADRVCYLDPIPLNCKAVFSTRLIASYHRLNCHIRFETDLQNVSVIFSDDKQISGEKLVADVYVSFVCSSTQQASIDGDVNFECNCSKATCTIRVRGMTDNCAITTHAFLHNTELGKHLQIGRSKSVQLQNTPGTLPPETDSDLVFEDEDAPKTLNCNVTNFPSFPKDSDLSGYAVYMRKAVEVMENWVYAQCFYKQKLYKIPDGIALYSVKLEPKDVLFGMSKKDKEDWEQIVIPFVQLLTNITGPWVKSAVFASRVPKGKIDQVAYVYEVYKNVLSILNKQGALLPHVDPEHLLIYEDYVLYLKYLLPKDKQPKLNILVEDESAFYLLSKQAWLDLLCQTHKVFIHSRVMKTFRRMKSSSKMIMNVQSQKSLDYKHDNSDTLPSGVSLAFFQACESILLPKQFIYNRSEMMLLFWLEYNFEKQRKILWPSEAKSRQVQLFDADLCDGLVLAATTAAYCPYLAPFLKDMYLEAENMEQLIHNATLLIETWRMIDFSFILTPADIAKPNLLQMLHLVNHLYEIMPSLSIIDHIVFNVAHTQSLEKKISIENRNKFQIAFNVVLFNNQMGSFAASTNLLSIPARHDASLTITYHARKLSRSNAYLVLNGDVQGQVYSKSMAFLLEGVPNISEFYDTLTFVWPMYDIYEKTFSFKCPYHVEAFYDIYFVNSPAVSIDTLRCLSWASIKPHKLPRRMYNKQVTLSVNKEGVATCTTIMCPMVPQSKEILSYFINNEIGDFSLKVELKIDNSSRTHTETLTMVVGRGFAKQRCDCKRVGKAIVIPERCPKRLMLNIPRKNNLLWECVNKMILECVDEREVPFWKKYLGTETGLHVLEYMRLTQPSISKDLLHIFSQTVTYNVVPAKKPTPQVTFPKTVTVERALSDGTFAIPIHVDVDGFPNDFYFNLESEDGREIRFYKVNFVKTS